jgi:hypothetical protein
VNIYSLTVATAVGKNGTQIYYTLDGAESWSLLSEDILNATGIYRGIVPVGENPLVNAFMTTENTMVVFGTYSDFTASSNGLSKVFRDTYRKYSRRPRTPSLIFAETPTCGATFS